MADGPNTNRNLSKSLRAYLETSNQKLEKWLGKEIYGGAIKRIPVKRTNITVSNMQKSLINNWVLSEWAIKIFGDPFNDVEM